MLTRIDHVGLAVPDLDEAIAFYARTFDVHVVHEEVNEEQGVREAMLDVGGSGSCIQLLAPLSPESPIAKFLDRRVLASSRWPTAWTTSTRSARTCDRAGCACSTTSRAAGPRGPGSTSSTPRTRWASWSSSSRPVHGSRLVVESDIN